MTSRAATALAGIRVLVVDDNKNMRRLVGGLLEAFGCREVVEAETAEAAWTALRAGAPDVAIVDWLLPGQTGLELVRRIRTDESSPDPFLPVIMLTGHSQPEHVRAARDAGASEFLAKPIAARALYSRIYALCERPRPFVRAAAYRGPCRRRQRKPFPGNDRRGAASVVIEA